MSELQPWPPGGAPATKSELAEVTLGSKWSEGESVSFYTPEAAARKAHIRIGSEAHPDTTFGALFRASRTISIAEAEFAGDGSQGLAAIMGTTRALSSSQGQAIGIAGGALTGSSYKGEHSLADAVGGYFIGRSIETSTRAGMGVFAAGEKTTELGVATGMEVTSINNSEFAGVYNKAAASGTKCINVHPHGKSQVAAGIQLTRIVASEPQLLVGIGINESVVKESSFQDWSESEYSIDIRKPHSKAAICVQPGAGQMVIGAGEPSSATPYLELFTNEATVDPALDIGSAKEAGTAASIRLHNFSGNVKLFLSNSTNGFVTGSGKGGTGIAFSGNFFMGVAGKTPTVAITETKIGFLGAPAAARQAAIESPAETLAALKVAVDKLREVQKAFGFTA